MYLEIEGAERYRAALYIRLSREDETDGPSESVSNQRAMLENYCGGLCPPAGGAGGRPLCGRRLVGHQFRPPGVPANAAGH